MNQVIFEKDMTYGENGERGTRTVVEYDYDQFALDPNNPADMVIFKIDALTKGETHVVSLFYSDLEKIYLAAKSAYENRPE